MTEPGKWYIIRCDQPCGEMAEWSKAADSKSAVPVRGTGGSNPSLSANFLLIMQITDYLLLPFYLCSDKKIWLLLTDC